MPVVRKHLTYPALFVAASNASARDKARADYVCDGVDDHVEIQAALDSSGSVVLSSGNFTIGSTIWLDTNDRLVGQGQATTLTARANLNNHVLSTNSGSSVFFVHLRDFRLDGNRSNQTAGTAHGIFARFAHTWLIENLHIKDTRTCGIRIEGNGSNIALNNRILNCRIENTGEQCLFVGGFAPNNHFVGNILGASLDWYAIECANDENIFVDCHIHTAYNHGIFVPNHNNIFQGVIVESSGGHGFHITGNGNCLTSCVSFNNNNNGFNIVGDYNRVSNCRAFDRQTTKTQDYGLSLAAGAENNIITDNNFLAADHTTGSIQNSSGNDTNILLNNFDDANSVVRGRVDFRTSHRTVPVPLTDAPTISVDAALSNYFTVTLGGNRTLGNPSNARNGQRLLFRIKQDGVGSRTLTLGNKYRLGSDISSIELSTAANKADYLGVVYDEGDDRFDVIAFVKGY